MELTKASLWHYLELVERPNSEAVYGIDDVRGVNNQKLMIRTKADVSSRDFTKFQIVMPGEFFFNHRTSRNGSKFSITYNYDDVPHIVTEDYVVFRVTNEGELCPGWLYLYVCRAEYDRYVIQNSWGSSTEFFNWEDFCETEILLPPIEVQREYVAIYEAMLANQRAYERGLDDLKLACDAKMNDLVQHADRKTLGQFVERHDVRNTDSSIKNVKGVSTQKIFREPTSKVDRNKLSNYKIVRPGWFSFVQTTHNEKCFAFAFNNTDNDIVVTSVNEVFSVDADRVDPDYLSLFFNRSEFDRYARFNSWGSARETFTWVDLQAVEIPFIPISEQKAIADVYRSWFTRKEINARLKAQLKDICPILIQGSIEEASR